MLEEHQTNVLQAYKSRKKSNNLSINLRRPTTANLRKECASVFNKQPDENIKNILESFGPIGFTIVSAKDILKIDPDKFRPLQSFINGDVANPNVHNVKLLAWLINFGDNDQTGEAAGDKEISGRKEVSTYFKENKLAIIISIVVVFALGGFVIIGNKQCMYWQGNYYEAVGCKIKMDDTTIVALDQVKLDRLKRITRVDTLGEKDLGKVWYVKIKVDSAEFYTDSGAYPLDTRKRLLPVTSYILNKYILKKNRMDSITKPATSSSMN